MNRPPIVEVEWVDAITRTEGCTLNEIAGFWASALRYRHTIGYLVHQDKRRVVLASDFDDPEQDEQHPTVSTLTTLPAGWVTKVTIIRDQSTPEAAESQTPEQHASA